MVLTSYNWDYFVVTPPAIEPITLDDVKAMIGISGSGDDALLTAVITAVRVCAENFTKRNFISTGFETFRNDFTDFQFDTINGAGIISPAYSNFDDDGPKIQLRRSPYLSDAAITYTDDDDSPQTLVLDTDFYVEKTNEWSNLLPISSWPDDVRDRRQDIKITFTAGYGATASDVPADLRHAMKMHVVDFYRNRGDCDDCEACISGVVMMIYKKYRILF